MIPAVAVDTDGDLQRLFAWRERPSPGPVPGS